MRKATYRVCVQRGETWNAPDEIRGKLFRSTSTSVGFSSWPSLLDGCVERGGEAWRVSGFK